jgi:tetratricopeptide (TPR) repeat protein
MISRFQTRKLWIPVDRLSASFAVAISLLCNVSSAAENSSANRSPENTVLLGNYANKSVGSPTQDPSPSITSPQEIANPDLKPTLPRGVASNALPAILMHFLVETNRPRNGSDLEMLSDYKRQLEMARFLRAKRQAVDAEPMLIELLSGNAPETIQQSALLELGAAVQDQNDLPRAQQIYAQFLSRWPNDLRTPEVLLRQGLLYRQMGFNNLALTKFYSVMTSALVLKNDQMDYYVRLVLVAQTEIAETHYGLGKYAEAADFFSRLLKQTNVMNRAETLYKLTRCHTALAKYSDAVTDAQDFLARFPNAPEQPEVRFHLAVSLKQLGRNNESLQQVLLLLQEQREATQNRPEVWAYWQQRAGNLIANHLYREGDYDKALEIYLSLSQLDQSLPWQLPVKYQIGMTYERLWQPQVAAEVYTEILTHEKELGTNVTPSLKAVFDMARWRVNFIKWQDKAEAANQQLHFPAQTNSAVTASLPADSVP